LPFGGQIASQVWFEPLADGEDVLEKSLIHLHPALDRQVTALTEGGEIPVRAVRFVAIEMVYGQHVARGNVMSVTAALTLSTGFRFDQRCDLGPVWRVIAHASSFGALRALQLMGNAGVMLAEGGSAWTQLSPAQEALTVPSRVMQ